MGFQSEVEIHDQACQYGDYIFLASGLVYRVTLTTLKIGAITTKDNNPSRGFRNHDEIGILTNTGYKHCSTTNSLIVGKPTLRVAKPEERKGSPTRGAR